MAESKLFALEDRDDEPYRLTSVTERDVFTTPSDPDVETLLKRIESGELVLRPEFQRTDVWGIAKKSKLIESLLLNLPIPPCFFAEDRNGVRVVVDGQQRLRAIDDFCHGRFKLTALQVMPELIGCSWSSLPSELRRKLLQRVIRTLVISHHTPSEIRFEIFERLNTGGEPLTDQEIRNGTLRGSLNDLLDKLAHNREFLDLIGKKSPDPRLRHHELVLRYLALSHDLNAYFPPLKFFLTEFMRSSRDINSAHATALEISFNEALRGCGTVFGNHAFRRFRLDRSTGGRYERVMNRAVFDIQMLGFAGVDITQLIARQAEIQNAFLDLCTSDNEFIESLTRATDHRSRLVFRMSTWFNTLEGIGIVVPLLKQLPRA